MSTPALRLAYSVDAPEHVRRREAAHRRDVETLRILIEERAGEEAHFFLTFAPDAWSDTERAFLRDMTKRTPNALPLSGKQRAIFQCLAEKYCRACPSPPDLWGRV